MFLLEVTWWSHRALTHLIVGGALERHPDLQLVFTEQGTAWVPERAGPARLLLRPHAQRGRLAGDTSGACPSSSGCRCKPSEYWARQCHIGASFIRPREVAMREQVGVDRIMWGSDYPHKESSHPFSQEAIRAQLRRRRPGRGAA